MNTPRRAASALVMLASLSASAATVAFKNGDRLTGEIETLFDGKLILKTEHAGEVAVDFTDVVSFESRESMKIFLKSGEILKGTVADLQGGWLGVRTERGIVTVALPMIAGINKAPEDGHGEDRKAESDSQEQSQGLSASWSGHVGLGAAMVRGNNDSSAAVADLAVFGETATSRYESQIVASFARDTAGGSQSEDILSLRWDRKLDKRWYLFTTLTAERDEAEALDLRGVFAAGVGRTLADRGRYRFLGELGLTVDRRDPIAEAGIDPSTDAEAVLGVRADVGLPHRSSLRASVMLFPDLSSSGYRVDAYVSSATPIASALVLNAALVSQTTSRPLPGVRSTDVGLRLSLAFTF